MITELTPREKGMLSQSKAEVTKEGVKVPQLAINRRQKMRGIKVGKMTFSMEDAEKHHECDPFALFVKAMSVVTSMQGQKILPGCTPIHDCEVCLDMQLMECQCSYDEPDVPIPCEISFEDSVVPPESKRRKRQPLRITALQCLFFGLLSSQQLCPTYSWILMPSAKRATTPQPASARRLSLSQQPSSFRSRSRSLDHPSSFALLSSTTTDQDSQKDTQPSQQQLQQPDLRDLYPPSVAHCNGTLQVDEIHTLYYEVHGNQSSISSSNSNNDDNNRTKTKKKSALFLHGGPGAGCNPTHARFFNPDLYDTIVLVDQRGCGKSAPRGQVYHNSLRHLIDDCERLREHLNVGPAWDVVLGGSWGSTLAVAYAQEHPDRVKSIVLRGVCLLRTAEVDWLFTPQGGAARQNPQGWKQFAETVGMTTSESVGDTDNQNSNVVMIDRSVLYAYYDRFFGKNATDRWTAARGWMTWEFTASSSYKQKLAAVANATNQSQGELPRSPAVLVSSTGSDSWSYKDSQGSVLSVSEMEALALDEDPGRYATGQLRQGLLHPVAPTSSSVPPRPIALQAKDFEDSKLQEEKVGNFSGFPAMPMLTCFYSVNDRFAMNDVDLIAPERMERLQNIPCTAIQGGMDPICPPDTALDVKQQWPGMELRIPLYAGHSMYHPELAHELVQATDRMASLL